MCALISDHGNWRTMMMHRNFIFALLALAIVAEAGAQTFPNRPLRIINPFPPGGGVDITNRILASKLTDVIGQQVVVENRPGAAGNVGAAIAAKSTPDG